ncbi:hypothetical protein F4678DRAFT_430627 [Xylaria arbuscula]|nr:hypothetical protein F4678DRAFT_430627 [Xylaria arbuscula]
MNLWLTRTLGTLSLLSFAVHEAVEPCITSLLKNPKAAGEKAQHPVVNSQTFPSLDYGLGRGGGDFSYRFLISSKRAH